MTLKKYLNYRIRDITDKILALNNAYIKAETLEDADSILNEIKLHTMCKKEVEDIVKLCEERERF